MLFFLKIVHLLCPLTDVVFNKCIYASKDNSKYNFILFFDPYILFVKMNIYN